MGQDAGDGSMARACLPALTALGQRFCPEERDLHTQDPSCEGYSGAGWERQSPKLAIHQLGTLSAQGTCTPQTGAMVTCCVTSGKFRLLSGLWLIFKRSWNSGFTFWKSPAYVDVDIHPVFKIHTKGQRRPVQRSWLALMLPISHLPSLQPSGPV